MSREMRVRPCSRGCAPLQVEVWSVSAQAWTAASTVVSNEATVPLWAAAVAIDESFVILLTLSPHHC